MSTVVSKSPSYTFKVTKNTKLTAIFEKIPIYTVAIITSPSGAGSVSGGGQYKEGATATIKYTTNAGYKFDGYYDQSGNYFGGSDASSTYSFVVTGNTTLTAKYLTYYVVNVSVKDYKGGMVTSNTGGMLEGDTAYMTAVPDTEHGYTFGGWYENGVLLSSDLEYSFVVTGDRNIVAEFKAWELVWNYGGTLPKANWTCIAYGNGLFVCLANNSNLVGYSADGLNWDTTNIGAVGYWTDITYGGGKFVAVASSKTTNNIAYSADGINWTVKSVSISSIPHSIAYGNGKYVVVGDDDSAYSTDGINWENSTISGYATWRHVVYGAGKFVATTQASSSNIAYSADGINWTVTSLKDGSYSMTPYDIAYGENLFVAIYGGSTSRNIGYSTDGVNWHLASSSNTYQLYSIMYGGGKFIAFYGTSSSTKCAYSTDGVTFTSARFPASLIWDSIAYGNGKYVAITFGDTRTVYAQG